jgi:hypothetical protein
VLFAAYASTLGLDAFGRSDYGVDEAHQLLTIRSVADDRDVDVLNQHALRAWTSYYPYELKREGREYQGRLTEPHFLGLPLAGAAPWALGGPKAVELLVALLTALAGACAYLLARRAVPDPWALGAALAVGLSPPVLAYSTAVLPAALVAAALAAAALGAVRVTEQPSRPRMFAAFLPLAILPWLGFKFLPAAAVIAWWTVRRLRARRRGLLALFGIELIGFSIALQVGLNEALFGGPTPHAADVPGDSATGADGPLDYAGRAWRAAALFIDREVGLLRWAPVLLLAFAGAFVLYRASRERFGTAIPELQDEYALGRLCAAVIGAQLIVAVFLIPSISGGWFPGRELVPILPLAVPLAAFGLRQAPRLGALAAAITLGASVWLWVAVRGSGFGLAANRPDAPFGPLTNGLPSFSDKAARWLFAAAAAVALGTLFAREELSIRRLGRE